MSLDDGEAHGRIIAGEGKGKPHGAGGFLHGPHATEILVISSVAGVLLMWLTFRKAGGGSSSSAAAPAVSPTGVTAGNVAGFDQASVQGLTDNLQTFQQANAAAFQGLSDALGNQSQGLASIAQETSGLNASISNQTSTLTNALTALPQQIASRIPAAQVSAPAPVGSAPSAPSGQSGWRQYTIQHGDTLSGIAAKDPRSWVTPGLIAAHNGIANPHLIYAGHTLWVPA